MKAKVSKKASLEILIVLALNPVMDDVKTCKYNHVLGGLKKKNKKKKTAPT